MHPQVRAAVGIEEAKREDEPEGSELNACMLGHDLTVGQSGGIRRCDGSDGLIDDVAIPNC